MKKHLSSWADSALMGFFPLTQKSVLIFCLTVFFLLANKENSFAQSVTIGPTSTSTNSITYGPMSSGTTAARYNRHAYIYSVSLLGDITNGDRIDALAFRKSAATAPTGASNFKVYIKNVSAADWGTGSVNWTTEIANATLVYNSSPNTIVGNTSGFKTFPFISPYIYNSANGTNIAILVEYTQTAVSTAITWIYDTQTNVPAYATNQTKYISSTAGNTPANLLSSTNSIHPQLRIDYKYSLNTTIEAITSPNGSCIGTTDSVRVRVKNLGSNTVNNLIVNWEYNGVLQTPFNYVGNILENGSSTFAIGSKTFSAGQPINIKVWTSSPNGLADKFPSNDTLSKIAAGPALAAGTYTVGPGGSYETLVAAVKDLNQRGICGPVVFDVDALGGPYIGQLELQQIYGASATNTITFNGNGATIIDTINASKVNSKHIVYLNGADYVNIDNFTITYEETSLYCLPIVIGNDANYNRISNCNILMDPNTTSVDFSAISFTGSSANYIVPTTFSNNIIENNTIRGGYAGIALVGTAGSPTLSKGNIIRNNNINDHYLYGIYVTATDSTQLFNNDIQKPTRVTYAGNYGIYITGNSQRLVADRNKIHDIFYQVPTSTSNFYAFFVTANDAKAGKEVIIKNNLIYKLNSLGTQYGLHNNSSDSIWYYHNTVHIDNPSATTGGAVGIYATAAATGVKYLNNNISISKAGNGNKHGVFVNTADVTATINYNNIYVDTTVGKTGQRNTGTFVTTPYVTLAAWKTANTNMWDQNSVSARSLFANVIAGNYTPNSFDLNNIGTPLTAAAVDYYGVTRNATNPDPGAIEFTPILNDAGITGMSLVSGSCTGTIPVGFKLKNYGANDLTSVQLNWSINGVLKTPLTYSGILGSGADTMVVLGSHNIQLDSVYTVKAWTSTPNGVVDNRFSNDTLSANNYKAAMAGTYTVGGVGAKYNTIQAAANDLSLRGVCGPVIINVNKNAGPYVEQVKINEIAGTSATNTVSIKGHGTALNFNSISSAVRYGFMINGADYVTIDSFIITPVSGANNYGWGIHLNTNSDYNTISNNTINLNNDNITQNYTGITLTGSTSVLNTTGGLFVGNVIQGNTIYGGYYNVNIYGVAGSNSLTRGNKILDNKMYDPYHYSVALFNQDSAEVSRNDMSRATRVTSVNFVGVYCNGIGGSTKINANKIHDAFNANPASTQAPYGVYFTNCPHSLGREALVTNNVIYNFAGSGAHYGLYAGGTTSYIRFYNNTISIDNKTSTTGGAYGFYQTGATTNIDFKNNNISITRSGTTAKYGIYLATLPPGVTSNYNNFYINASGGNVGYYSSAKATLADWKLVNVNAYDQNSVSADPEFLKISANNFVPNNSAIDNIATPIAAVTTDHTGATRSGTPDIGAYEFTPTQNDAELVTIVGPNIICVGANPVQVKIKNQGLSNLTSLQINWSVNNITQTPFNFTGSMPKYKDSTLIIGSFNGVLNNVYNLKVWTTLPNGLTDQNTLNDTSIKSGINTGLAGNYTIGAGASNYTSFNQAVNDLIVRGVCGAVVFNVDPTIGVYDEKVTIPSILGSSTTNTITFKGNLAVLSYEITATGDRGVLTLNGAKNVIIDSLIIQVETASTYGYPIVLTNGAENNIIRNSQFKAPFTTSSNYAGFVMGSISSISSASTSKNNTIENNLISGGYYGLTLYGTSGSNHLTKYNIIRNNKIQDFYYYGLYHYYSDSTQIISNDISRPNNTVLSATTYTMYIAGASQNILVDGNIIHNMFDKDQTTTGTFYTCYLSTGAAQAGKQTMFRNNLVHSINTSGTQYGLYSTSSGNVVFYNNTVVLDFANATAGTTYGYYHSGTATGVELLNNNFYINRAGTGTKYGIYMVTAAAPLTTNYNNIYVPNGNVGYNSSARITLADWKAVNPTFDVNSVSVSPIFPYRTLGIYSPSALALDNMGAPLASVPTDILGNARNLTTPDIGAYEFTPTSEDVTITKLNVQNICVGVNPIQVNLRTLGYNTLASVNINWSVNGVTQTMLTYSGSLAPGLDTMLLLGSYNFAASTIYNLRFWTSLPNGVADQNNLNDTLKVNNIKTGLRGVYTIGGAGANYANITSATNDLNAYGVCGNVTFNVNPAAGPYNEQITFEAIKGTSDTSKIVFNGNGATVTFNSTVTSARHIFKLRGTDYLTIDSFNVVMNAASTYGFPIHVLSGSNYNTIKRNTIRTIENLSSSNYFGVVFSGTDISGTSAGSDMSFNTVENNRVYGGYYGISFYGTTATFTSLKGNTIRNNKIIDSYLAGVFTTGCDSTLISGNDLSKPGRTVFTTSYGIYNSTNSINSIVENNRIHNPFDGLLTSTSTFYGIYHMSSDSKPGRAIVRNNLIYNFNGMGGQFGLGNNGSDSTYYFNNTVVMSDTMLASNNSNGFLQTSTVSNGVKLINNNFVITRKGTGNRVGEYWTTATSTFESNFNNFYIANGTGVNAVAYFTNFYTTLADWQASNFTIFDQNSVASNPLFNLASSGNFTPFSGGFDNRGTPLTDVTTDITGALRNASTPDIGAYEFTAVGEDAGVTALGFSTACIGINPVSVTINNSSANLLSFVDINWSVNGVMQPMYTYTGGLPSGTSTNVTIGSLNFAVGQSYLLKFWTSAPNGLADANSTNDTLLVTDFRTALNGTYTVGGVGSDFANLTAAAIALNKGGVCGPVVLNMNASAGPYVGQVEFKIIPGTSSTNTVYINGKGSVVNATITSTENRSLIRLNGVKYLTIDSLEAEVNAASTNGYVLTLGSNSNYNTIKNSKFKSPAATSNIFGGILFIGLDNSPTAPSTAAFNTIENNIVEGGFYGISIYGTSGLNQLSKGNIILNNTVKDFYQYGIYNIYADSTQIVKNDISRMGQSATTTTYAIYSSGVSQNLLIERNKVHHLFELMKSNTSTLYGIYISSGAAQVGKFNVVKNNLMYSLTNSGAHYCLYNATSGNTLYYNNTIVDDYNGATAGATYGLYQTGNATGIEFKNNNLFLNRTGSGLKYGIYMATSGTPLISNYNNIFVPNGNVGYNLSARITMSDWRKVMVGIDTFSLSVNPVFTFANVGNFSPTSAVLNDKGVALTQVTDDITGAARSTTTPDIGAYEFSPFSNDISVSEYLYPSAGTKCGVLNDSVVLVIINTGASTQSGFNIRVNVTGANTATLNKLYTGNLLSGEADTITIGTYSTNFNGVINLTSIVQLGTDVYRNNDTIKTSFASSVASAMPVANNVSVCKGSNATLVATSTTNNTFRWYDAAVGGNLLTTNDTLITPLINSTTKYYVSGTNSATVPYSLGPVNYNIGANGNFTNATVQYLEFDALSTFTLDSVSIYPNGPGNVEVRLLSNTGAVLQTKNVAVTTTQVITRIPVGFTITPGTAYRMDGGPGTTTGGLWRNTAGAVYPYTIPGVVSITGNSFSTVAYYYYYNWKINGGGETCPSERKEVIVNTASALAGTSASMGAIYNGVYNAGTLGNPDRACALDTLEYTVPAPTGFTNADFGTTWTINTISVKNPNNTNANGALTVTGRTVRYIVNALDIDSNLLLSINVKDLSSTICDTQLQRNISISKALIVSLGNDTTVCFGQAVTLNSGIVGQTYLWSTGATTQSISATTTGTYTVTVTNLAGCSTNDQINVTVSPTIIVNLGPDKSICSGVAELLDAGTIAGATYLWNSGATTQSINVINAGEYWVKVTVGTCFTIDTINITVVQKPTVNLGANVSICIGDSITLDAGGTNLTYLWNTGATTQTINVKTPGTYSVTVSNTQGCSATDDIVITNKVATNSNYTANAVNGLNWQFNGPTVSGLTYNWNFGDPTSPANTSQLRNPLHLFTAPGTYNVTLTTQNVATGCISVTTQNFVVQFIGIHTEKGVSNMFVAPNPFTNNATIHYELTNEAQVSIDLVDMLGRVIGTVVNTESQMAGNYQFSLEEVTQALAPGVYQIRMMLDGRPNVVRIVKSN